MNIFKDVRRRRSSSSSSSLANNEATTSAEPPSNGEPQVRAGNKRLSFSHSLSPNNVESASTFGFGLRHPNVTLSSLGNTATLRRVFLPRSRTTGAFTKNFDADESAAGSKTRRHLFPGPAPGDTDEIRGQGDLGKLESRDLGVRCRPPTRSSSLGRNVGRGHHYLKDSKARSQPGGNTSTECPDGRRASLSSDDLQTEAKVDPGPLDLSNLLKKPPAAEVAKHPFSTFLKRTAGRHQPARVPGAPPEATRDSKVHRVWNLPFGGSASTEPTFNNQWTKNSCYLASSPSLGGSDGRSKALAQLASADVRDRKQQGGVNDGGQCAVPVATVSPQVSRSSRPADLGGLQHHCPLEFNPEKGIRRPTKSRPISADLSLLPRELQNSVYYLQTATGQHELYAESKIDRSLNSFRIAGPVSRLSSSQSDFFQSGKGGHEDSSNSKTHR